MASINGISLKGVTNFQGHEGEPLCQGNLYLNNRKIGFWSQDFRGGSDHFDLDSKYDVRMLSKAVITRNPDKALRGAHPDGRQYSIDYGLDLLLSDLTDLMSHEKAFKKAVKSGYTGILIATDGYHHVCWNLPASYTAMSDEELFKSLSSEIEEAKKSFFKENKHLKHTLKVYRSPLDFTLGEPVGFEEIMPKKALDQQISNAYSSFGKPKHSSKEEEPER